MREGDLKWNLTPHKEFLPVELGAWNSTPIRINRLSPSPDPEAEFTARADFSDLIDEFLNNVNINRAQPEEGAQPQDNQDEVNNALQVVFTPPHPTETERGTDHSHTGEQDAFQPPDDTHSRELETESDTPQATSTTLPRQGANHNQKRKANTPTEKENWEPTVSSATRGPAGAPPETQSHPSSRNKQKCYLRRRLPRAPFAELHRCGAQDQQVRDIDSRGEDEQANIQDGRTTVENTEIKGQDKREKQRHAPPGRKKRRCLFGLNKRRDASASSSYTAFTPSWLPPPESPELDLFTQNRIASVRPRPLEVTAAPSPTRLPTQEPADFTSVRAFDVAAASPTRLLAQEPAAAAPPTRLSPQEPAAAAPPTTRLSTQEPTEHTSTSVRSRAPQNVTAASPNQEPAECRTDATHHQVGRFRPTLTLPFHRYQTPLERRKDKSIKEPQPNPYRFIQRKLGLSEKEFEDKLTQDVDELLQEIEDERRRALLTPYSL